MKLRKAADEDQKAVFDLAQKMATSFTPERKAFDAAFKNILADNSAHLTVATDGTAVIGYCLGFDHYAFYANGRVSWVEEVMVLENFRRKGIGRMLMNEFAEWSSARKSRLIGLATRRAGSFYEALGYEESAMFYRKLL